MRILLFSLLLLTVASSAFAHSTVSPSQTYTQKNDTYSVSVPTEKEVPTVGVRLLVPEGIERVTPLVKPGWQIATTKNADGVVTEIRWTGGAIPNGQKDIFQFSARAPATSTVLAWKVYQMYLGGEVVAWDQDPSTPAEGEEKVARPYSVTEVLAPLPVEGERTNDVPLAVSMAALVVSLAALWFAVRK